MILKISMPYNEEAVLSAFHRVLKTVHRLRAPGGCPWDREQTHQSLRPFLVEEAYETLEILDQIETPEDLKKEPLKKAFIEEWGDVLLQILLHAEIANEVDSEISFQQIADALNEKMIRRHPHVFAQTQVENAEAVVQNWEQIKKEEKKENGISEPSIPSVLDGASKGLPPLPRTMKVIQKVTKVGFQWPDLKGPTEKLEEEVRELKEILSESDHTPEEYLKKVESEIGDVLFSVCNIAYFMKLDPEAALRSTLRKFESRFRFVEKRLHEKGKTPKESNLVEMDQYWDEAKAIERSTEDS